jgi:SAM-dependent methyltransferase
MLEWPRRSVCDTEKYLALRAKIKNPGPGRPKTWAYPWCIMNARLGPDMLALDYGCGFYSNFTYVISELTKSLTVGMDMAGLRRETGKVRFVQNTSERIDFPTNFFDRVFSISVLEHVPLSMRNLVLSEIFRVLRPGGLAVFTIDWVFGLNAHLLRQLTESPHLQQKHSTMYGNYDFARLISDHAEVVAPLCRVQSDLCPGTPEFREENILADDDILVTTSDMVPDVEPFRFTTVGLILKKHETPGQGM